MDTIQQLLNVSQKLYAHLSNSIDAKERDEFIQKTNELLDARGVIIEQLKGQNPNPIYGHPLEQQLITLDKGIRKGLVQVKKDIADDMKQLQIAKKSEQRYVNPYAAVRVMDGTYYDKKK